jgi:chorismate mutase
VNIFSKNTPYIIAGPCGAESEEQMLQIATSFKSMNIDMIRAGVWKPRSKPGMFEGRGEIALQWLQQVKKITNKPVCTEVATTEQLELALKYNIDAVWLGARTTVNPFLVQELADALKGTNVPVLIKNPINPDIDLWSGAIERILKMGVEQVCAIHRGFSSYDESSKYRNKPNWPIPIELKRRYPTLPIICDVSHICGNRTLLQSVAQRSIDLQFDGLMIETHPTPDDALSDAKQQITPETLDLLLHSLVVKSATTSNSTALDELAEIRSVMDSLDAEIIDIIGKRMQYAEKLGVLKQENNITIYQPERWREIVQSRTIWGGNNKLNNVFILKLFELIHEKSIKTQREIIEKK